MYQGNFPSSEKPDIRGCVIALGIDPGSRHLGWGVIRADGNRLAHVAHGVIDVDAEPLLARARAGVEVAEYAPAHVKLAVAGRGNADKRQVAHMVRALLALDEPPRSD